MITIKLINISILFAALLQVQAVAQEQAISTRSISWLEKRLTAIDNELGQLASFSMRGGIGSIGYRSGVREDSNYNEWIRIDLSQDIEIDQIVLVPTIWRDTHLGLQADGFPEEFEILAGKAGDEEGIVIARYDGTEALMPRIAPLAIHLPPTTASWIKLTTTTLPPRIWDHRYALQLSEIMVFSGEDNVALNKPVSASSEKLRLGPSRHKRFLVDGFVPYLMDAATGERSSAFMSKVGIGDQPALTIDLGDIMPINRMHLHACDLSDTIPQALLDGFGTPRKLRVEGANQPDFSDTTTIAEFHMESIYEVGPIIMRGFPEASCRYVRLTAIEPFIFNEDEVTGSLIGFAEIEIFSNGRNVARGRPVSSTFKPPALGQHLQRLSDGNNFFGRILPLRQWMNELAHRHDLEVERRKVATTLQQKYTKQKKTLNTMYWLAAILTAGIGFTILINRVLRMRHTAELKERFAADLHDELGANLHAIGMLSELANSAESKNELLTLFGRSRAFAQRSITAVRYCTDMLEAKNLCEDLVEDMNRSTSRLLNDIDFTIQFEGEEFLSTLSPRRRLGLFLFHKECLANIIRHSSATQVDIRLCATSSKISLSIIDNGHGIGTQLPVSLKRRARLLRAQLSTTQPQTGGTHVALNLKRKKWNPFK